VKAMIVNIYHNQLSTNITNSSSTSAAPATQVLSNKHHHHHHYHNEANQFPEDIKDT